MNTRPTDPLRNVVRGHADTARGRTLSNFRLPINVYAYFAADGTPLYVGQTQDLLTRHGAHRQRSPWFWFATRFEILAHAYDRPTARKLEAKAIRTLQPENNYHHNPRFVAPRASATSGRNAKREKAAA